MVILHSKYNSNSISKYNEVINVKIDLFAVISTISKGVRSRIISSEEVGHVLMAPVIHTYASSVRCFSTVTRETLKVQDTAPHATIGHSVHPT